MSSDLSRDTCRALGQRVRAAGTDSYPLRFVVEPPPGVDQAGVRRSVMEALGLDAADKRVRVEPLLEMGNNTGAGLSLPAYFVVSLALNAADASLSKSELFDAAYALRDVCDFRQVDPELPETINRPDPANMTESLGLQAFAAAATTPANWHLKAARIDRAWALEPPPGGQRRGRGIVIGNPDTGWAHHPDIDINRLDLKRSKNILTGSNDATNPLNVELDGLVFYSAHGTAVAGVAAALSLGVNPPPKPRPPDEGGIIGLVRSILRVAVKAWQALNSILNPAPLPAPAPAFSHSAQDSDDLQPSGVAPEATIIPIRFGDSVIVVTGINLARAVNYAARQGVNVIMMSVGGVPATWLEMAIADAVHNHNCIVVAAAGNGIPFVAAPAFYPDCVAVTGTNIEDRPWPTSSFGVTADIAAPADLVWRATFLKEKNMQPAFMPGSGTSFSCPIVAGIAALWLAYHGPALEQYRGKATMQQVFMHLLAQTRRVPDSWNDKEKAVYGGGIIDAEALLSAPLPDPDSFGGIQSWQPQQNIDVLRQMGRALGVEGVLSEAEAEAVIRRELEAALDTTIDDLEGLASDYGAELAHLLYENRKLGAGIQAAGSADVSNRLRVAVKKEVPS